MKNKLPLFSKSYAYKIEKDIDLEKIIDNREGKEYHQFQFKKETNTNGYIYKYLISSRAGDLFVCLEKDKNTLYVYVYEGLFGLFIPSIFLTLSIYAFIKGVNDFGLYSLLAFCVFFLLILFSFQYYTNQIKNKIEKAIKNLG
jgi:hypothetical protein